jgi:hypothetical protein
LLNFDDFMKKMEVCDEEGLEMVMADGIERKNGRKL